MEVEGISFILVLWNNICNWSDHLYGWDYNLFHVFKQFLQTEGFESYNKLGLHYYQITWKNEVKIILKGFFTKILSLLNLELLWNYFFLCLWGVNQNGFLTCILNIQKNFPSHLSTCGGQGVCVRCVYSKTSDRIRL